MLDLNNARMILVQFSFSNSNVVPPNIQHREPESIEQRLSRKAAYTNGTMILEPTKMCSLANFLNEIEVAGYVLIDSFHQRRMSERMKSYHVVRFVFVKHEFAEELPAEFLDSRDVILSDLDVICHNALWRVRVFLNSFYRDAVEIPGQKMVSINLEARQPLFHPAGQPITIWNKDINGERVGEAPVPIQPLYQLSILNNTLELQSWG